MKHTILVVEDNAITRKMLNVALSSAGFEAREAGTGASALHDALAHRPALVILDYLLPDTDGLTLLGELRGALAAPALPAIIMTGMVSRLDELGRLGGAHTQLLAKPVEPARLIEILRAELLPARQEGNGRRVLVVDDDPLNLKLAAVHLRHAGYEVETALGGAEALLLARRAAPDAILSDVLMPGVDGFALCSEVRHDPLLAHVPVVLVSSSYAEAPDRDLALRMGASALVTRTGDLAQCLRALHEALQAPAPGAPAADVRQLATLHGERLAAQLERQTANNELQARQITIQATALSVVRGLSAILAEPRDMTRVVSDVLVQCLDATGLSTGVLYLVNDEEMPRAQARFGIPHAAASRVENCFGNPELLRWTAERSEPVAYSSDTPDLPRGVEDFLARLGLPYALLVPFPVLGLGSGVLLLASDHHDLSDASWLAFARSVSGQFGQTISLADSLTRLASSESRLREAQLRLDHVLTASPSVLFTLSARDGKFVADWVSPNIERFLGYTVVEALAPGWWSSHLHPEDRDAVLAQMRDVLATGSVSQEYRFQDSAGAWRWINAELRVAGDRPSGATEIVGSWMEVTEKRSLEAQLHQAQKMESVGRLAGGVAHDFNNILGVITGYAELLHKRLEGEGAPRHYADEILKASERAAALTRQLLAFSRRQVLLTRILDLNEVVRGLEGMLHRLIGEDVALETRYAPALPAIRADAGQLEQVIMNLVVNARDAMPKGGSLLLETGAVTLDGRYAAGHAGVAPGDYAMLAVSDTGSGMTPEVLAQIFEPFYTTKEAHKGTGLGLATVHGIVRQSGGHIFVYSEPGLGTTFKIYLPSAESPAPAIEARPERESPRGTETVLVVEDEPSLREIICEALADQGYRILSAENGDEALRRADAHPETIHLLLTDLVMPGQGGSELAQALSARRPDLRVLYMSGYTDDAAAVHEVLAGDRPLLEKPFTSGALARKVRLVLDAAPHDPSGGGHPPR